MTLHLRVPRALAKLSLSGILLTMCVPTLTARSIKAKELAVEVTIGRDRARISNSFLSIEFSLVHGRLRTSSVRNFRSARTLAIDGDDFILEFADGHRVRSSELQLVDSSEKAVGSSGRRVSFELQSDEVRVTAVTEMNAADWWATRWLEIEGSKGEISLVTLSSWRSPEAVGLDGPGHVTGGLGFPSGYGQIVYAGGTFLGIAHPGAGNYVKDGIISCSIAASYRLSRGNVIRSRNFIIGVGQAGAARRAFLGYIDATRPVPARMLFLVNDWWWKDKDKPVEALESLSALKRQIGIRIDSFTLDDGWDFDWDTETGIWGRLNRIRFPGGWDSLISAGKSSCIGLSLWFGPIGGYSYRSKRLEFARKMGFELNGDKLCLAGPRYRAHVIESFARWAGKGMDYIKVDGFWPECQQTDHGHPVGAAGAIAQMDSLMGVFAAWRQARPSLSIGYTSGSNPSPFWLQHADYVWRGGADDNHAGAGEPFDRHNTYLDSCLQPHRTTQMPVSAFVTFDIVQGRIAGNLDDVFEKGCWWLAARTSLHHDWYVQTEDLSPERWKMLAKATEWAKGHESLFRWSRMVGGDPAKGEVYGFSSFDDGHGTLALRNPSGEARTLENTIAELLGLSSADRQRSFKLKGVFGETRALGSIQRAEAKWSIRLSPLAIAVLEVEPTPR